MRDFLRKYWCIILFGVCLAWAVLSLFRKPNPHIETVYVTDTVYSTKIDTLKVVYPTFIEKKVVDTFLVYVNDSTNIALPIEQKRYAEPDKYELYISGVDPKLDTIRVFNKTEYRTVTNTVTNNIYKYTWRGYLNGQLMTFNNEVIPSVGLTLISPNSWLIGGSIGLYNNKPTYQLSVGYKLFGK